LNANKSGVERWGDMQRKYEETAALLNKQMQVNEDLNQNLVKLKELNS
jgi:hypothetical protein